VIGQSVATGTHAEIPVPPAKGKVRAVNALGRPGMNNAYRVVQALQTISRRRRYSSRGYS